MGQLPIPLSQAPPFALSYLLSDEAAFPSSTSAGGTCSVPDLKQIIESLRAFCSFAGSCDLVICSFLKTGKMTHKQLFWGWGGSRGGRAEPGREVISWMPERGWGEVRHSLSIQIRSSSFSEYEPVLMSHPHCWLSEPPCPFHKASYRFFSSGSLKIKWLSNE